MAVLTVNINDKKDKKALKALKAVIEAFGLNYDIDQNLIKEGEAVSIFVTEGEEIQKQLNTENYMTILASR